MDLSAGRRKKSSCGAFGGAALLAMGLMVATPALAADVIRVASPYQTTTLDPIRSAAAGNIETYGQIYSRLLRRDPETGKLEPGLAEKWEVSQDGLTYTFKLKSGVTFHSGDPLTAADVKYSIERVTAEASKSSRKKSLSTITGIETPDDQTVVITLSARSISLPYNLSYVWIVNDKATDITATEDGTGPYTLGEWRRGSALALNRNDKYWGTAATNGEVIYTYFTDATALNNALLTNAVDVITSVQSPDSLAQFSGNPAYKVTEGASTTKEILAYNDRVAPFDNVKVRKALARATDKAKLLNSIWGDYGTLIGSFVPPTDPWYVDLTGVDPYDVESAKALLAEAGYPDGFEFTLDTPDYDPHPIVAQFLQAEYAKVGVKVNINIITANEWYTKIYQEKNFQATLQEHVNHRDIVFYGNPDFYWGYNNPEVVKLIADSEAAATIDEQTAKLTEANKLIAEDAASNWLYLYPQIVVSAANVSGYPVNGLNSQFFAYGIQKAK